ncbi:DUF3817 domain-containing protein [Owenweeksia hongkongensis]|uniref:DUF3817 domain-containing protein n=1 Tax=Owenweeksia hongkongensis TaxID=253245 RepID=UPI003A9141B6
MENKIKALKQFHIISILEGASFLLLMFIAMPLKYMADYPLPVKYTGWAHGVLFIAYLIVGLRVAVLCKWPIGKVALAVLASLLPFGPFVFDRTVKKEIAEREAAVVVS